MSTKTQAKPIFAATLTPHRSLTPAGKRWVIGLVAALALVPGVVFYLAGAWPVVGFMGLDVLAIWAAFTVSMRRGKLSEELTLWPTSLELKKIDAKGKQEVLTFGYTTRRRFQLGAFLSADEKLSLSKVFGTALRKARH